MNNLLLIKTFISDDDDWAYLIEYENKSLEPSYPLMKIVREQKYSGVAATCFNPKDDDSTFETKAIAYFDRYVEKQKLIKSKIPIIIKRIEI